LVRSDALGRTHIGLDFFDASINRVAAWAIGTRNAQRALLLALSEPATLLNDLERAGDYTGRLALLEELKGLPFGAVWDYYCHTRNVPVGAAMLNAIRTYEHKVFSSRAV
jgi:L-rhamnose isomerase